MDHKSFFILARRCLLLRIKCLILFLVWINFIHYYILITFWFRYIQCMRFLALVKWIEINLKLDFFFIFCFVCFIDVPLGCGLNFAAMIFLANSRYVHGIDRQVYRLLLFISWTNFHNIENLKLALTNVLHSSQNGLVLATQRLWLFISYQILLIWRFFQSICSKD